MSSFLKIVSGGDKGKSPLPSSNAAPSPTSSSSSSMAPVSTPKNKSSARPIEISDKKDKGRPTSSKQLPLAQSAPSSLFFMPPKAPAPKPKAAPFEPPPMELPPSPPVYSPLQQFNHIAKRHAGPKPSSRVAISSSAPSHAEDFLTSYNPTFAPLVEGDDEEAREREYERKLRQEDSSDETGNDELLSSDDEMFGSGGTDDEIDVSLDDDDGSLRMPTRPVRRMSDANSLSTSFREAQIASEINLSSSPTIISFLQGPVPSSAPTTPLTALSIAKTSSPSPSSRALTSFSAVSSASSDSTKISGLTASLRAVGLASRSQAATSIPTSSISSASSFKSAHDDDDDMQFEMSLGASSNLQIDEDAFSSNPQKMSKPGKRTIF